MKKTVFFKKHVIVGRGFGGVNLYATRYNSREDASATSGASSATSGSSQVIRYVPFKIQFVVLALYALLGCWYVLRPL